MSPDGARMVFTSYRRSPGDTAEHPNATLWYADRAGEGWGEPIFMAGPSQHGSYHSAPWFDRTGSVHYRVTSPDWRTSSNMMSGWDGEGYGAGSLDSLAEKWRGWRPDSSYVWGARIAPGEQWMLVDISPLTPGGRRGPSDLWVSFRSTEGWTEPRRLGADVNRPETYDNFAEFSPDGCELIFVRGFSRFYHVSLAAALGAAAR